jgi:Dienelactone hydrolase and related enzymes
MCFELDSEPPIPRISGAAVSHDDVVLASEDGNHFAAFQALPEDDFTTGIVILPDVRGLYRFYEELALRFAERGYAAVAFDYFGRTAGVAKRGDDFDYRPHVDQLTPHEVMEDVGTCLRLLLGLDCTSFFTVGFCFGGSNSWVVHGFPRRARWSGRLLRAAVASASVRPRDERADPGPSGRGRPSDQSPRQSRVRARLREAGKEYELVEYEGAPHSFFDRKQEEFQDASDDAWRRTLEFIETR